MNNQNYTGIIPAQQEGDVINAESSVELADSKAAAELFETAKQRLLNVNGWHELAGRPLAHFYLTDATGEEISGPVSQGNYFKIDIPGPGTEAGNGFDWAKVEEVELYNWGDVESVGIRVRPAANPTGNDPTIAHFYDEESTSTFTVTREQNKLTARIIDRNIKTNSDSEKITDQIRNKVVGFIGMLSFSKVQWKSLADGLIEE
ncbi:hypothetical protein [Dyadobacter psychrotolerans]|uniref:Uncharacterized protein n=1 Tax=Dyadobacter psychrotolerans TaxID=2541721 RepID=A0A4R5DK24_9BACT|nr:hypothetical protein [Dyadobacter psychrotolerans]TDE14496.1 hypothetical protein E0F88_14955 [Dyadobacter psychrotolerans]